MTPIQTNKPLFFNLKGEPLNGTIYIGQPNVDPRTNAKTVTFRDSGGSEFTAKQPLNTVNGRIVYNGKPITALVDGEYSLLSFDASGAQVEYDKSILPDGSGAAAESFSELIRAGLTLSDIKAFDVSVGDVVRSVGSVSAKDGGGADWIVISSTGVPGNDVDLIDFDNGLQGQRYHVYPYYRDTNITLGNGFSNVNAKLIKVGKMVTLIFLENASFTTSDYAHASQAFVIPEEFRYTGSATFAFVNLSEYVGVKVELLYEPGIHRISMLTYSATTGATFNVSTVTGQHSVSWVTED